MNKEYKKYLEDNVINEDNAVDIIEEQRKEIERLNNIINKAIKYIEDTSHKSYFSMLQADYNMSLDTLIDILEGSDKE